LKRRRALLTLKQQLHTAQSALDLSDARDHAHLIENVGRGFVSVVALRNREHESFAAQRRFYRSQCSRPASRDWRSETGEDHGSAQREDRQGLALSH
jgi:hypothetical protein